MEEHESDILIADEEDSTIETADSPNVVQTDTLFEPKQNMDSPIQSVQQQNKTIKKETDAFVNYNYNNLNKVYKKYDVVQTYVPKKEPIKKQNKSFETFVTEQNSYTPEKETLSVERVSEKPKFEMKSKAKVWLCAFCAIFVMLGGLSIYNGIKISNLQNQIAETTTSITNYNKQIETTIKDIGKLTDDDTIIDEAGDLGLSEATDDSKVTVVLEEKNKVQDYKSETNFFDKICNFFRNLFGG